MHTLRRKLHNRRGESLAEVLVAMLVIALAVLLLASMVSAAGSIDMETRTQDTRFYKELSAAEQHQPFGTVPARGYAIDIAVKEPGPPDPVTNEVTWDTKKELSANVTLYGGDHLLSYQVTPVSPGGGGGGGG